MENHHESPKKPPGRVVAIKGSYSPEVISQTELRDAAELQATVWLAEKNAREAVQDIERRVKDHGATIEDGQYYFDRELQMVRSCKKEGAG